MPQATTTAAASAPAAAQYENRSRKIEDVVVVGSVIQEVTFNRVEAVSLLLCTRQASNSSQPLTNTRFGRDQSSESFSGYSGSCWPAPQMKKEVERNKGYVRTTRRRCFPATIVGGGSHKIQGMGRRR